MIISCPECRLQVSSKAPICPHCGYPVRSDAAPAVTVRKLYEEWTDDYFKTIQDVSARAVKAAWAYCSSVYDMQAAHIRARHIKNCMENGTAVVKKQRRHPSAAMKNRIKSLFNLMFDYAVEYELVDRNYARTFNLSDELIKEITEVKKEHIPFADEEIEKLWANADVLPFAGIILIQCYSGWRPQELGLLELKNVDLENWIFTGGMKTDAGTGRTVPIHPRIRPLVLKNYSEALSLGSAYLFNSSASGNGDTRLTYPRYRNKFLRVCDDLKLNPDHRPHDGRIHFVTAAKKAHIDEYAIKYMVGHKISDITERVYTKREPDWLRREIEKME